MVVVHPPMAIFIHQIIVCILFKTSFGGPPKADNVLWMDPNISESQDAMAEAVEVLRHAKVQALHED